MIIMKVFLFILSIPFSAIATAVVAGIVKTILIAVNMNEIFENMIVGIAALFIFVKCSIFYGKRIFRM